MFEIVEPRNAIEDRADAEFVSLAPPLTGGVGQMPRTHKLTCRSWLAHTKPVQKQRIPPRDLRKQNTHDQRRAQIS